MITLYDSIEVGEIPANAQAVAGYTGGKWPTFKELTKRFPKAQRVSIAIRAADDGDILDIENGDASVGEAPAWFHRQKAGGAKRPGFYTSLSNINLLIQTLEQAGIPRADYRLWGAHYTYSPHICGPSEGIGTYCDGTQYSDRALGRNLDVSLCADTFFAPPKPAAYLPADERRWEAEWDVRAKQHGPWPYLRRRVLKRVMLHRERQIVEEAWKTGWAFRNRHDRYRRLFLRTKAR